MQIILLERIEKLGGMGDIVQVKNGYARNFLLPQGKALRATEENKHRYDNQRDALERLNLERRTGAATDAGSIEGASIILIRQASDTLQLYGSVTAKDVADAVTETGVAVKRQQVRLDRPIKTLGVHDVRVALHPEVVVTVLVNVARSEQEAEIQAKGGTIGRDDGDRAADQDDVTGHPFNASEPEDDAPEDGALEDGAPEGDVAEGDAAEAAAADETEESDTGAQDEADKQA